MADFFLGINGTQLGPYPEHELVARGMKHDTMVWRDGMTAWVRADQLPEMIQYLENVPRPAVTVPNYPHTVATNMGQAPTAGYQYGPDGVPINPYAGQGAGGPQQFAGGYQQPQVSYVSAPFQANPYFQHSSNRIAAGVLGILLGGLGVHKFVLGYTGTGFIMLLASVLSCGALAPIVCLIGVIEGIIYLTKTDQQFIETYQANSRTWF